MVIDDIQRPASNSRGYSYATPQERLAAVIIDLLIVIVPLASLIVAPFRKYLGLSSLLNEPHKVFIYSLFIALGISFVTIAYKVISTAAFGATFGQRLLGLKVLSTKDAKSVSWENAILRSVFWMLGPVTLGFSWMGIFSESHRRAWHDRVSDTCVVTRKKISAASPHFQERTFARAYGLSVLFLFAITFFILTWTLYRGLENSPLLNAQASPTCEDVDDAFASWPPEPKEASADRLEVAMTLFAAGQIGKSCLEAEVDYHFRQGYETPLAYLASSFIHSDEAELSDRYLKKACELLPDSQSCKMSQMIELWSEGKWQEIDHLIETFKGTEKTFVSIWVIRHLVNQSNVKKALAKIEQLRGIYELSHFLSIQYVKAKWIESPGQGASALTDTLAFSLPAEELFEIDAWVCSQQLTRDCESVSDSPCSRMLKQAELDHAKLKSTQASIAYVRARMCDNGKEAFGPLNQAGLDEQVKAVVGLMSGINSSVRQKSLHKLREVLADETTDSALKHFVLQALIDETDEVGELDDLVLAWEKDRTSIDWIESGRKFVERFNSEGLFERALTVGQVVAVVTPNDTDLARKLVVFAFKANRLDKVATIIKSLSANESEQRAPASLDGSTSSFDEVIQELRRSKPINSRLKEGSAK